MINDEKIRNVFGVSSILAAFSSEVEFKVFVTVKKFFKRPEIYPLVPFLAITDTRPPGVVPTNEAKD
ncbi:MAG: hypothetical protein F6K11_18720 [Leptolyngbya sp. SIO3F4]|nr:hypothetical protein [Leptolyngbya sp. SIO3F4]